LLLFSEFSLILLLLVFHNNIFHSGYEKYPADGGIGLGMISEERDSKIENGVDLMQALANAEQEIDKRVFGIYINELGDIFKDYALVLGGIDY